MDEKRNVEYKFRVTKSESEVIEKRFEDAPINSMSAFLRQQVVHGIYLEFDKDELETIRKFNVTYKLCLLMLVQSVFSLKQCR